jgi:hypothetical protein
MAMCDSGNNEKIIGSVCEAVVTQLTL